MFGRDKKDAREDLDRRQKVNEAVKEHLRDWAADLKKPYQAAGFELDAAISYVDQLEALASGSSGHPWPPELKIEMVRGINGAANLPDLKKRVEALQLQYEAALRGDQPVE